MSDRAIRIEEISRSAQRFLCSAIISQMLVSKGILDAGYWILDAGPSAPSISDGVLSEIREQIAAMPLGEFPFEVLSDVYEDYLLRKLVLNNSTGEFEYLPESQSRKRKGVYYTPGYIVSYIVDRTLGKYLWETESGRPEGNAPAKTLEDIRHLRILDPACGSGSFLVYAFDVLAEFYALQNPDDATDWPLAILRNHLYGIDLDGDAVDITGMILELKALELMGHMQKRKEQEALCPNVRQGNFLISNPSAPQNLKPFNWQTEMPEILDHGGFTLILGNPPYGAQLSKVERKLIRSDYETYKSSDSSSLFIERAVNMLKCDGTLGFVLPKSLSYVVSWQPIRKLLLDQCRIVEIADAWKAFRGVRLEQIIMIAQKQDGENAETVVSILRPEYSTVSHSTDTAALSADRFSMWLSSRRLKDIVDRMWEKSVPLGHIAEIWSGLSIQALPVFLDMADVGSPTARKKKESDFQDSCPCLRGKDIQRYHVRPDIQYVKMADVIEHQRMSLKMFCKPKIVVQDIIAHIRNPKPHIKLTAAIDRSRNWLNVNTVTNIASSEYHLAYLCGILNSRLISWYAYDFIYNRAVRTMHFRRGYADHIPIRCVDPGDPCCELIYEQLVEHVSRTMTLYCEETTPEEEIAGVDREIDRLIYQLYGITDDDVGFLREHAGFYSPVR